MQPSRTSTFKMNVGGTNKLPNFNAQTQSECKNVGSVTVLPSMKQIDIHSKPRVSTSKMSMLYDTDSNSKQVLGGKLPQA